MTRRTPIFIAIVVVIVLFIVGTWQTLNEWKANDSKAVTENASGTAAEEGLMPGEEPNMTVDTDQLVSGFPNFPIYPEARFVSSYRKTDGNRIGYEARWVTEDPLATVDAWYVNELREGGWAWMIVEEPSPENVTERVFTIRGDGGITLTLMVEPEVEADAGGDDDDAVSETHIVVEIPLQDAEQYNVL